MPIAAIAAHPANRRVIRGSFTLRAGYKETATQSPSPQNVACRFPAPRSSTNDSQRRVIRGNFTFRFSQIRTGASRLIRLLSVHSKNTPVSKKLWRHLVHFAKPIIRPDSMTPEQWSPRRIRSHISLCYLTYAVAKQSIHRLKKKGLVLSIDEMRHRLRRVQASKIIDKPTQNRYVIPSATDKSQLEIYAALDLERSSTPYKI